MKKLVILVILTTVVIPTAATAAISFRVCEADGTTLFDNRDIMVDTKLTIIASSDSNVPWDAGIFIGMDYYGYGELAARGPVIEDPFDWSGSHFPSAGDEAVVIDWADEEVGLGFYCYCGITPEPNDWYIIDYNAVDVGDCNVTTYDKPSNDEMAEFEPNSVFAFHHVPTRDFYQDTVVNFADYAILAGWWQQDCESPGGCGGADLDDSNDVDFDDLMLFCDYWLKKTEY